MLLASCICAYAGDGKHIVWDGLEGGAWEEFSGGKWYWRLNTEAAVVSNWTAGMAFEYPFLSGVQPTPDVSGGGHDGGFTGGASDPTFTTNSASMNPSYWFDGADEIVCLTTGLTHGATSIVMEARAYHDNNHGWEAVFAERSANGSGINAGTVASNFFRGQVGTTGGLVVAHSGIGSRDINVWYHLAFTWKSGDYGRLYLNGKLEGISDATMSGTVIATNAWRIGRDRFNTAYRWKGYIADPRVATNVWINDAEVETNAWLAMTNIGYSVFDYAFRAQWSNAILVQNFEYDFPADSSPNTTTNHGTKGASGRAPTHVATATNGYYSFDGGDVITNANLQGSAVTFSWWGYTNSTWYHYGQVQGTQYVNGSPATFVDHYWTTSGATLVLGRKGTNDWLTGYIDEFRIWDVGDSSYVTNHWQQSKSYHSN
jgi:hypothetical protein